MHCFRQLVLFLHIEHVPVTCSGACTSLMTSKKDLSVVDAVSIMAMSRPTEAARVLPSGDSATRTPAAPSSPTVSRQKGQNHLIVMPHSVQYSSTLSCGALGFKQLLPGSNGCAPVETRIGSWPLSNSISTL